MLGGKIQTVKFEENTNETETADFFVRYANQEVTLNIAYYMNGKITKTVVIWLVEFPDEHSQKQMNYVMNLLDEAEKIKKDVEYAEKIAKEKKRKNAKTRKN